MLRIEIKHFGPLKDINLELKDYMVFIGENASGKSTLSKLVYLTYQLPKFFLDACKENISNPEGKLLDLFASNCYNFLSNSALFSNNIMNGDPISSLKIYTDSLLFFEIKVNISPSNPNREFETGVEFNKYIADVYSIRNNFLSLIQTDNLNFTSFRQEYLEVIETLFTTKFPFFDLKTENLYIPEKRDFFNNQFPNQIDKSIFKDFNNVIENAKYLLSQNGIEYISDNTKKVLKGSPEKLNNSEYYGLNAGNRFLLFDNLSSGQKALYWILIYLDFSKVNKKSHNLFFEEPELHTFNETQLDLLKFLVFITNQNKSKLLITTHSQFIIGIFNVFVNANRINKLGKSNLEAVLPKNYWIEKENVFIGLLKDGTITNVYDEDAEMFDHSYLNSVGGELNNLLDKLFEIEFENE